MLCKTMQVNTDVDMIWNENNAFHQKRTRTCLKMFVGKKIQLFLVFLRKKKGTTN